MATRRVPTSQIWVRFLVPSLMDTIEEIEKRREIVAELRKELGVPTAAEIKESRIQSIYASLAIEDPNITEEEVREILDKLL